MDSIFFVFFLQQFSILPDELDFPGFLIGINSFDINFLLPQDLFYCLKKRLQTFSGLCRHLYDPVCLKIPEIDVSYSIFTPSKLPNAQEAQMTGLIVRLKPNTWVTEQMISHGNYDESLLLLKGELELRIDNSTYMIYEGDSFYIPKNCLHNYLNTSNEEATIIVYFSQLVY